MSKHGEILEFLFEEMDRHDANLRNSAEWATSLHFVEGLTIKDRTTAQGIYDDLIDAGYSPKEAKKAALAERRKFGLGG